MKFKKRKVRRQRASTHHGWGHGAAHHKGAGNRGGRGRAGSGKKADQKKPSYWQERVGKHGFTSKSRFKLESINVSDLERSMTEFVEKGYATKKGTGYEISLKKAGYAKLLASGKITTSMMITVDFASASAIEKVKAAKGSVTVTNVRVKKEKKKPVVAKKKEEAKASPSEE